MRENRNILYQVMRETISLSIELHKKSLYFLPHRDVDINILLLVQISKITVCCNVLRVAEFCIE